MKKTTITLVDAQRLKLSETIDDFNTRWKEEEYYAIAMVGIKRDGSISISLDTGINKKRALLQLIGGTDVLLQRLRDAYMRRG